MLMAEKIDCTQFDKVSAKYLKVFSKKYKRKIFRTQIEGNSWS